MESTGQFRIKTIADLFMRTLLGSCIFETEDGKYCQRYGEETTSVNLCC